MPDTGSNSVPSDFGYGPTGNPGPGIGEATIDAPQTNKAGTELKLEARSVKTIAHAWTICKATEQSNRTRAARTSDIQSLHDGAPPRSSCVQAEKAKSWQSNASTNWLAGITGRVAQRFVHAIINQLYVTASSLPEDIPDWKTKTDLMRAELTTLIRSWNGYTQFINSECVETVLQGYCYAVFLDPYTWKPTFFKQDWAFCPEYAGQHARDLQFFVAKMDYRLDEFIALFTDGEEAAEANGYDIKNCVWAANNSKMINPPTDATTTQFRNFVEMINEGVLGLTYTTTGARVVNTYLLFNREYDGKVSFWLIDRDSGKQLRFSFKLFESMEMAIAMFSFEPGNGCIHSSKGLGRKLVNLAIMKEVFRNSIIDSARMSGNVMVLADSGERSKAAPTMHSPWIFFDKGVEIPAQQFNFDAQSMEKTDLMIDGWAEQSTGAWITQQINEQGKAEKTATEAQIDARRESEAADIQIRRQLDQFANMTQIQQLRAFSDDNITEARAIYDEIVADPEKDEPEIYRRKGNDAECMRSLVKLMKAGITDNEIKLWRSSPASPYAHVSEGALQQGLAIAADQFAGDPNVDQAQLKYRKLEGMVGADEAKKLFIPVPDETVVAESRRQQITELGDMMSIGVPIPVSARDNHLIHGTELQAWLTNVAAPALSDAAAAEGIEKTTALVMDHFGEHLKFASAAGQMKVPAMQELDKFYTGFKKQFEEAVQIRAEATAAQEIVAKQISAESAPPAEATAPAPQVTAPNIAPFQLPPGPPRATPARVAAAV